MKANELMVGDWVIRRGVPEEPMRLYDMNVLANVAYLDQDGRGVAEKFKNIEPIPLTDEFLRKNGFEYYHGNCAALSSEDKFSINQVQWPDEDGIAVWEYGIIQIRFVHEFQHLLKLCGIEKEIVL